MLNNAYTADTLLFVDDEEAERDVHIQFIVPKSWAEEWCRKNQYTSLSQFDSEYVWDESWWMYWSAVEDDVILYMETLDQEVYIR